MSTQIVDNFQLNVAKPIDSRMVTSGTASRDNLQFTYEGLRVYDIVNKAPYVFINGAWQQESSSSIISNGGSGGGGSFGTGTVNRLLKYSGTGATNSAILDIGSFNSPNIGIGKTPGAGVALDIKGDAVLTGSVTATLFIGKLDGANILINSLPVSGITPGANNQILKTEGSGNQAIVKWVDQANSNISIQSETTATSPYYLLFSNLTGSVSTLNSNAKIGVKPSTSQILGSSDASTNSASAPGYAFATNTTAGLYGSTTEIGLSFNSKALLKLYSSQLSILDTAGTTVLSSRTNGVLFGTDVHSYPSVPRFNPETQEMELIPTPRKEYPLIISKTISSATEPSYTWNGDAGTGMYRPGTNQVALTTNGVARFTVTNSMTTISTPTTITGAATLSSTLTVAGAATLSSTLTVAGATTLSSTLAVTGTSGFTGLATFNSLVANTSFKLTPGAGPGKILTSDATGTGTWKDPTSGAPYGTIIMWIDLDYVPRGWKGCRETGDMNTWIYLETEMSNFGEFPRVDRYHPIPDMRDRLIIGDPDMTDTLVGGGTQSATTSLSTKLNMHQLPPHWHDPGTLNIKASGEHSHTYNYADQYGSAAGLQDGVGSNKIENTSNTQTHTHAATDFSGSTSDMSTTFLSRPIILNTYKHRLTLFIIRYNPDATLGQLGHVTTEAIALAWNAANPARLPDYSGNTQAG
jgi:hypothetical protein